MLEISEQLREKAGILNAGGDPLVHDNAHRHDLLPDALRSQRVGDGPPHADEHAGGAELIAVVENAGRVDGGQIRHEQAGVERTQFNDRPGQQIMPV